MFLGGWLLIANLLMDSSTPPSDWTPRAPYNEISNYGNGRMGISGRALKSLRNRFSFTQLRFYCRKQRVRRTFHVTTVANSSGKAVVQYFTGEKDEQPKSCGSFVRMEDDNSQLASMCDKWGGHGFWGRKSNPGGYALFKQGPSVKDQHSWQPFLKSWKCDDYDDNVSTGDFWRIYVR